ncbi:MAG: hypothetical protein H6734_12475 [Alphaproteobacteria bacterium]|nr:hypothetical protein [Alphaproteobacteria bacterium]
MLALLVPALASPAVFRTLEPGLELAVFTSPVASGISDEQKRTGSEWMDANPGWVAVVDASMFQTDHRSSVLQLEHGEHWNNATWHPNASNLLVFDGEGPDTIVDVRCESCSEATLVVRAGGERLVRVGSYEIGFFEDDSNAAEWGLPNVVALARR